MAFGIQSKRTLGIGLALDIGQYFKVGPRFFFHWDKSNTYTYMDFLGGTYNQNDIGYIVTLRLGIDFIVGDNIKVKALNLVPIMGQNI